MEKEIIEKYKKAGNIAAVVRDKTKKMIKSDEKLFNIANTAEDLIRKLGGEIAFPINLSINEISAHYTPYPNDDRVIKENDVVKIDVGVHVDGYIADTATTVALNKDYSPMVNAVDKALENALNIIKAGINTSEIGAIIEETITNLGFKPIRNLSGHGLDRYNIHAGLNIPNIRTEKGESIPKGRVIAIEPFATDGGGSIKEGEIATSYLFLQEKPVRSKYTKQVLDLVKQYKSLPFASRWLVGKVPNFVLNKSLNELVSLGVLHPYKFLREVNNGIVTHAEHTVLVLDKPIVITKT